MGPLLGALHPASAALAAAPSSGDPLFAHGVGWFVWVVVAIKVLVAFAVLMVSVMLMIWFERKVISDMQSRIGPEPGRTLRAAPDARRRDQAVLQGGPAPRPGGPRRLQAGPLPRRSCRRSSSSPSIPVGGVRHHRGPHLRAPGGRPADRHPVGAGHVVDRGLRRDARRLVVGLEVPAARLGAGVGPDDLLRGRPRPDRRDGRADHGLAVDPGHRRLPRPAASGTGTSSDSASCRSSSS